MKIIKSKIIPLPRKDIDTDLIIPADFLKITDKEGLGKHLFERLRMEDENFPFNLKKYQGAKILVARENFGCGSSREHAAWALKDWGIEVVIAPSFSDIFYSNARQNFILPVILKSAIVEKILVKALKDDYKIIVDLPGQMVILPGGEKIIFDIDPYKKQCLIDGMDDMDYLLGNLDTIRKFSRARGTSRRTGRTKIFFNIAKV